MGDGHGGPQIQLGTMICASSQGEIPLLATTTMLLVSADQTLIDSVRRAIATVSGLRLKAATNSDEVDAALGRTDLGLVLVHLAGDGDAVEARRLYRAIQATG